MAGQAARELVIKREMTPGNYVFVCGIRTRSFSMSSGVVDTTKPNCDNPGDPIVATGRPGRLNLAFSGDGLFDTDAAGIAVADDARLQRQPNYQVIVPGYGTFEGPYMVGDFEFSGDMEDDMAFSATWTPTNNSLLTFTPATP